MIFPIAASVAVLAAATVAVGAAAQSATAEPATLDVRLNAAFAPDLVDAIARVGSPVRVRVPNGTSFRQIITERCGAVDPAYVVAFLRENPALAPADLDGAIGGKDYLFPACARAPALAFHTIQRGDTISRLFRYGNIPLDGWVIDFAWTRGSGTTWPQTVRFACLPSPSVAAGMGANRPLGACSLRQFAEAENAYQFLRANPDADPSRLLPGQTEIRLPRAASWSTIVLRDGVDPAQALTLIRAAASGPGRPSAEVERASVATLIGDTPVTAAMCHATVGAWPYSADALEEAVAANQRVRPAATPYREARVLMLDTGFDDRFAPRAIPPEYLGRGMLPGIRSGAAIHPGVNLAEFRADARPPAGLANGLHGSEVGATLLGGPALEARRAGLRLPIRMIFASLAVTANDGTYLSSRAIFEALRYARSNNIPIINGSVFATENRREFIDALGSVGLDVLLVTAAGNSGQPFEDDNLTWPGALGGQLSNGHGSLIVTVGSHDGSGAISEFSRRGGLHVDLLAPGCAIPTFSLSQGQPASVEPVERSGTSYAAPIVSLIAAYMYAEGLSPPDIKARLLTSVDVDMALESLVYSSGRLNISKALALWQDVVQYWGPPAQDGVRVLRTVAGTLVFPFRTATICNRTVPQGNLRKLSIAGDSRNAQAPRRIMMWRRAAGAERHELDRQVCDVSQLSGQDLVIRDADTGANVSVRLEDVADFVARSLD